MCVAGTKVYTALLAQVTRVYLIIRGLRVNATCISFRFIVKQLWSLICRALLLP